MILHIRREQFDAMQREWDIRWFQERLQGMYPSFAEASLIQQREWLDSGLRRATAYGLDRADVFQFLCFEQTFERGSLDQPAFAWARDILSAADVTSAERVKRLRQRTINMLLEQEALDEVAQAERDAQAAFDLLDESDDEEEAA